MNFATTRHMRDGSNNQYRNHSNLMAFVKPNDLLALVMMMLLIFSASIANAAEEDSVKVLFFTESDTTITLAFFYPDGALLDEDKILSQLHLRLLATDPTYIGLKPLAVNLANVQVVTVFCTEAINLTSFEEMLAGLMSQVTEEKVVVAESNKPSPGNGQAAIEEPELVP